MLGGGGLPRRPKRGQFLQPESGQFCQSASRPPAEAPRALRFLSLATTLGEKVSAETFSEVAERKKSRVGDLFEAKVPDRKCSS
jgi:hypothetical protein